MDFGYTIELAEELFSVRARAEFKHFRAFLLQQLPPYCRACLERTSPFAAAEITPTLCVIVMAATTLWSRILPVRSCFSSARTFLEMSPLTRSFSWPGRLGLGRHWKNEEAGQVWKWSGCSAHLPQGGRAPQPRSGKRIGDYTHSIGIMPS